VGEGGKEGVRRRVRLLPGDLVDELEPQPLQREAEDDVTRARHPWHVVGLENAPLENLPKPFERIESLRALRFRMLLGEEGAIKLNIMRAG
jgi:hypothetical protein